MVLLRKRSWGSSHGATLELATSYVEFRGIGVLEEAATAKGSWAEPHLTQNPPDSKSVKLRLPPDRPFGTIPQNRFRNRNKLGHYLDLPRLNHQALRV